MRLALATLTFTAFGALAQAQDLTALDEAGRGALREEIRAYLLENPEVLLEALQVLDEREQAAAMEAQSAALYEDEGSWVGGNPEGDVTLVEFVDYACGYCKRVHPTIRQLVAQDGNIRVIRKEYPVLGEQSVAAARFAIAVHQIAGPDAYMLAANALIDTPGRAFQAQTFEAIAGQLGLDWAEIAPRMESDEVTVVLANAHRLGRGLQISSTPSFVLDGEIISGARPLADFEAAVAAARDAKG